MAWVKVPAEHHPLFHAALPVSPRVERRLMFGGVAASVNGHIFAGLFGRSVMLYLDEDDEREALALEGAGRFDPMGDGRKMSNKVMLPEAMMDEPAELKAWIGRAFAAASKLAPKAAKKPAAKKAAKRASPSAGKKAPTKKPAANRKPAR